MSESERSDWIKKLMKKPNKTSEELKKLGEAYERHIQLLKDKLSFPEFEVKSVEEVPDANPFVTMPAL